MPAATSTSGAKPAPKKGILKKPKAATAPQPTEGGTRSPEEARQVAIRRATIIQQQKAVQQQVLDDLINLSQHPRVRESGYNAAKPAPDDVAEFKAKVRKFQPSDYDDLIEERNVNELCGYALCARPRKRYGQGTYKAVNLGRPDFKIMAVEELEKWCSQDCARRALYVKVQLSETAAWERIGIADIEIELIGEETGKDSELVANIGRLKLEEHKKAEKSSTLAFERGDTTDQSKGSTNLVDFTIREKKTTAIPEPPSLEAAEDDDDGEDMLLDGYKPRF